MGAWGAGCALGEGPADGVGCDRLGLLTVIEADAQVAQSSECVYIWAYLMCISMSFVYVVGVAP